MSNSGWCYRLTRYSFSLHFWNVRNDSGTQAAWKFSGVSVSTYNESLWIKWVDLGAINVSRVILDGVEICDLNLSAI